MSRIGDLLYIGAACKLVDVTRDERMASLSAFLRKQRGTRTQREVAEGAGLNRTAYNSMENGRRGMGEEVAGRLAAYYGEPVEKFQPYITDDLQRLRLIDGDGEAVTLESLHRVLEQVVATQERILTMLDSLAVSKQRRAPRRGRG